MLTTTTATPKKQPPGNLRDLHHVQQKIVCRIHGCLAQKQHAPTNRELMSELNIAAGTLQYHLDKLEELGWIKRISGQDRNIQLWFQFA